ncbi:MAG: ATP-binding protein [Myxococcaceae bacterium]|nr:ATP-binding protein [Myxococcaceae bacterium]
MGARQTGKSSLLKRLFPNHRVVSLDLRLTAQQAEESPESFLKENPPPLIIDEVQYAPGLFRHLKMAIDRNRSENGQFILTGSQKFAFMKEVSDSLAGRAAILELPGLSAQEIINGIGRTPDLSELLARGGFPAMWADEKIPIQDFYQSYVSTYLERDLRQLLDVGNLRDFERCLRAYATRAGQLLNKSDVARDVGISPTTSGHWLSALQASNQITLLEPFFGNVGKRLTKSPKLFLNDVGMLCFFLGLTQAALSQSALVGAVWENFVHRELSIHLHNRHPERSLWFYRDQQNREVDFIVQGPFDHLRLIDAKWAEIPSSAAFDKLTSVAAILKSMKGIRHTELMLIARSRGIQTVREGQHIVSGLAVGELFDE